MWKFAILWAITVLSLSRLAPCLILLYISCNLFVTKYFRLFCRPYYVKSWHEKGKNPYKMTRTSNILLNSSYVTEADLLEIYRANTCNPCTWANSRESAFPWTGQACKAGTRQKLVWKSPVVSVNGWPRVAGYLCYISVLMFLFVCLFIQHNRRQGIKSCSHPSSFPSLFPSASSSS